MIPGLGPVQPDAGESAAKAALGALDGDAFLKLLVAQMRYQNPLSPTDTTAMLQQTAMLTQVETMQSIATAQQQLMGFQSVLLASDLVGQEVTAIVDGGAVSGTVEGVRFTEDGPLLSLAGREIPIHLVDNIGDV